MEEQKTEAVAEGDDVAPPYASKRGDGGPLGHVPGDRHYTQLYQWDSRHKLDTAVEALEVAGLEPKAADENLVMVIAAVPADGPSGTLNVVTARRVLHALEGAGYSLKKK